MIILLALVMLGIGYLQAQVPSAVQDQINHLIPQQVPTSPNVASLGKFGDYKVSYFSGLPEISIPIYEIKSGSISIPITLSYHAAGVKPTDVASWVGLGWALSAGGHISRSVKKLPDELYYYSNVLNANASECTDFGYLNDLALGYKDSEPDIFSFNYPGGGSGKFILSQGGAAPYQIPASAKVVKPYFTGGTYGSFPKFEIIDESGMLYRFGTSSQGGTSTEYTSSTTGGAPQINATTAWNLMDVVAPNSNDQVFFSYQDVGTATTWDKSYSYTVMQSCYSVAASCPFPYDNLQNVTSSSTINQQGVHFITFKNGKVEFVLNNDLRSDNQQMHSLDRINIYSLVNGTYILQKTAKFVYSYFTLASGSTSFLKLDAVQFLDNTGKLIQQYKLTYHTNSFSWDGSRANFPNARDLWGYFNGAYENTDLILPKTIGFQQSTSSAPGTLTFGGGVRRTVDPTYSKEGVLKQITFPTGGYTLFDFEQNQYLDDNGNPALAGGLRIKQITDSDGSGASPMIRTFKYGQDETGNGIPNFHSSQLNSFTTGKYRNEDCDKQIHYDFTTYNAVTYNMDSFDQSPVMYPYVTEYLGTPGSINGKTIYEFDNGQPPGDIDNSRIPFTSRFYRDSFFWKRGHLTKKKVYDNASHLLSKQEIIYANYRATDTYLVGLGVGQYAIGFTNSCGINYYCITERGDQIVSNTLVYTKFYQTSGVMLQTQVNDYTYENGNENNYVMKQTFTTYDGVNLVPTQNATTGRTPSEQLVTVSKYPFQLSPPASSTGNALGIYMLNQKNIVASPMEIYTYLQNTDGTNQRIISGQVTTYRANEANSQYVVPDKIYLWESAQPVSLSGYTALAINGTNSGVTLDANQKARVTMVSYDTYGNLLSASKINDPVTSYLYGYNSALPIAEATNAQNATGVVEFFYESFEENNGSNVVSDASVAHSGKRYQNGTYTATFVPPNGRGYVIEYWYRNGSVWQQAKVAYTGSGMVLNSGTAIDDVRIYPSDAQVKSYTYDPVMGMTSAIDASGYMKLYDYDGFGRLKRIRNEKGNVEKQFLYNYKGN